MPHLLAQLSQLELLKDLHGREDQGVDDASDGEGPSDNGADCRQEVIHGRSGLVVFYCDGVQIVPAR